MRGKNLVHALGYFAGFVPAQTQTTPAEQALLRRYASGKRSLVELGVMHGVNTALLRSVMAEDGRLTGVDPHPPGALFVSLERSIARRELGRHARGTAELLRCYSYEAATRWNAPIDFLFIDGDHSWQGVDRDWRDWSPHLIPGGCVALHDSRPVGWRKDLDSVRYLREVVSKDARFREIDAADSLTILERLP